MVENQYLINTYGNFTRFTTLVQLRTKISWTDFQVKRLKVTARLFPWRYSDRWFAVKYFLVFNCFYLLSVFVATANKASHLPPIVDLSRLYPLLETYDSYVDYFKIVQPLLLLDTWESVWLAWFLSYMQSGESTKALILMP